MLNWATLRTRITGSEIKEAARQGAARTPLTAAVRDHLRSQMPELAASTFEGFTIEKRRSDHMDAREDVTVFDPSGKPVYAGRCFSARVFPFWRLG